MTGNRPDERWPWPASHFGAECERFAARAAAAELEGVDLAADPQWSSDALDMTVRQLRGECLFGPRGRLRIVRVTWAQARRFLAEHHRHHRPPAGWLFGAGVEDELGLVGVVVCGRPVSRALAAQGVAEVTRLCTLAGATNAASRLYAAVTWAAGALGFPAVDTYTRIDEHGSSLRASGFVELGRVRGRSWSCPSRPREDSTEVIDRVHWRRELAA